MHIVGTELQTYLFSPPSSLISFLLDLVDARTRPVWNRRLAEEWRECLCTISVRASKLIIACGAGRSVQYIF